MFPNIASLLQTPYHGYCLCEDNNGRVYVLFTRDPRSRTHHLVDGYESVTRLFDGLPPPQSGPNGFVDLRERTCVVISTREESRTHLIEVDGRKWVCTQVEVLIV
tara:strand:- start:507 stop:821 length:315 start_codon:yes stop_codon:yes gene_type:complete